MSFQFFNKTSPADSLLDRLESMRWACIYRDFKYPADVAADLPLRMQKLPVIAAQLPLLPIELRRPTRFGFIELEGATALYICVHLGPRQVYFLANAADPLVWAALDKWDAAGFIATYLDIEGVGGAVLMGIPFHIDEPDMRQGSASHEQSKRPFLAGVTGLIEGGLLSMAQSILPEYPVVESPIGCIFATDNTLPASMSLHVEHFGHSPTDSANELTRSQLRPSPKRPSQTATAAPSSFAKKRLASALDAMAMNAGPMKNRMH